MKCISCILFALDIYIALNSKIILHVTDTIQLKLIAVDDSYCNFIVFAVNPYVIILISMVIMVLEMVC